MTGRPAARAPVSWIAMVAGVVVIICACSSGGGVRSRATPYAGSTFDPRGVTLVPSPSAGETDAARQVAADALQGLVGTSGGAIQLLIPAQFSGASVVDLLRVSAGAGAGPAEARSRLIALGWSWLVTLSAVEVRSSFVREWRVELFSFTSTAGAERYAANPFLERNALLTSGRQSPPREAIPDTALYRAADRVSVPVGPATPTPGERAVLLWRRGRIVAAASEEQVPAGVDLGTLGLLARLVDEGLLRVPGSVAP